MLDGNSMEDTLFRVVINLFLSPSDSLFSQLYASVATQSLAPILGIVLVYFVHEGDTSQSGILFLDSLSAI